MLRAIMFVAVGLSLALGFALPPCALRGAVVADAGLEYDSNPNRAVTQDSNAPPPDPPGELPEPPHPSPLARAQANGQLQYLGVRQRLRLALTLGGKVFFLRDAQDQNVGVLQFSYEHGAQLGRSRLLGIIDYYDAYQAPARPESARDLRSLSAGGRFAATRPLGDPQRGHNLDGSVDLTGNFFMYKPDDTYSFLAPSLAGRLNARLHAGDPELGHDFDVGGSARLEYRGYQYGRIDLFFQAGAAVTWQGPLLAQLGYTGQLNSSTRGSESYQRHLILGKLAFRIPGDFYITLKGQLNLLVGAPGIFVPVVNIDDDNRSLVVLDIERPLARGFALAARYTGYFSLPSDNSPPYQRHTVYLGFSYSFRAQRP